MVDLERLGARLLRLVAKRCPHWPRELCEDVAQEALIKVNRILNERDDDRPLPTAYLARCAYTAICDELRRARWRFEVPADEDEEHTMVSLSPSPSRRAWSREIARAVRHCLRSLRADRRYAVWLHLQGYSARQTAELLAWKPRQAENLIFRGRTDLRQCLRAREVEP